MRDIAGVNRMSLGVSRRETFGVTYSAKDSNLYCNFLLYPFYFYIYMSLCNRSRGIVKGG